MKVLLVAHACHPDWGSESSVGWKVMRLLSREHDVHVLTAGRNRAAMEQAVEDGRVPSNVRVSYAAGDLVLSETPMVAKVQEWPYYRSFLRAAMPVAEELHARHAFDLTHHVTFAAWRMGAPFWKLGIPQVFGPVGGGEQFDFRFFSLLSLGAAVFEAARVVSNWRATQDPGVRQCLTRSARILVSNRETEAVVLRLGAPRERVQRLMVVFFPDEVLERWKPGEAKPEGRLRLIAGGALEGRKGVALAIRALALAAQRGLDFEYRFTMGGPEAEPMKALAAKLGIAERTIFSDTLPRGEYESLVKSSHVYLLPSLRDNTPSALMEAMLAGCVPVVADCGGPSLLVPDGAGVRIPLSKPEAFIRRMADEITALDANRERLAAMGLAARRWICSEFCEETYRRRILSAYEAALSGSACVPGFPGP